MRLAGPARSTRVADEANSSDFSFPAMTPMTEITLVDGGRYRVEGDAKDVERRILDAARGSIMEFTWLTEVESGEPLGVNPACVVMLRAVSV